MFHQRTAPRFKITWKSWTLARVLRLGRSSASNADWIVLCGTDMSLRWSPFAWLLRSTNSSSSECTNFLEDEYPWKPIEHEIVMDVHLPLLRIFTVYCPNIIFMDDGILSIIVCIQYSLDYIVNISRVMFFVRYITWHTGLGWRVFRPWRSM